MTTPKEPLGGDQATSTDVPEKKAYEKPAFVREQIFETMALACGKVNPTSGACKSVRKTS
jgi:hypothetical protein